MWILLASSKRLIAVQLRSQPRRHSHLILKYDAPVNFLPTLSFIYLDIRQSCPTQWRGGRAELDLLKNVNGSGLESWQSIQAACRLQGSVPELSETMSMQGCGKSFLRVCKYPHNIISLLSFVTVYTYIWLPGISTCRMASRDMCIHINLTHYHIFPWLCAWDVCYIIFCHLLHIDPGKTGILLSLLLCSLWWVQIFGYEIRIRDPCVRVCAPLTLAVKTRIQLRVTRLSTWAKRGGIWIDAWVCLHYWVVIWVAGYFKSPYLAQFMGCVIGRIHYDLKVVFCFIHFTAYRYHHNSSVLTGIGNM